jgi:hypothetical protein
MNHVTIASLVALLAFAPGRDDKEDLVNAAKKVADAKSYSFKGETKMELPAIGGQGGGNQDPQKFEGKHEAEVGTHILTDSQEVVKIGNKTASRPRAEWRVTTDGAEGGDQGGGRRGGFGRMLGGMGGRARAPHEDFKDFGSKLEKVTKSDKKETIGEYECDVYNADLTEDAAKALLPGGGMMGRMQQQAEIEIKGKGKFWVMDGAIVKSELTASLVGSFQGNDFEMSATRTTSIFDIDKTKVTIPEDAKKAIDKAAD